MIEHNKLSEADLLQELIPKWQAEARAAGKLALGSLAVSVADLTALTHYPDNLALALIMPVSSIASATYGMKWALNNLIANDYQTDLHRLNDSSPRT